MVGGPNGIMGLQEYTSAGWEQWGQGWNETWLPSELQRIEMDIPASQLSNTTVRLIFQRNTGSATGSMYCFLDNLVITQYQPEILEENNYYPFGLRHNGYNDLQAGTQGSKFKYNSKELNSELGLEWYDFGARNYDAALGRWMNMDPLAENSRRWSPYVYAYNNPLRFIDPDGMQANDLIFHLKTDSAKQKVQDNLDSGLGRSNAVTIENDGNVKLNVTRDELETDEQKAMYDTIKAAIDNDKDVDFEVSESDEIIPIAMTSRTSKQHFLDIDDINEFGEGEGANQASIMGHEIKERLDMVNGIKKGDAHDNAVIEEEKIAGSKRDQTKDIDDTTFTVKTKGSTTYPAKNGKITRYYTVNGKTVTVSNEYNDGNVFNVQRGDGN